MKKNLLITSLLTFIFTLLLGFLGFYFLSYKTVQNSSLSAANKSVIYPVSLLKDRAEPDIVIVKFGDYVQFNSMDGKQHKIGYGSGDDYEKDHEHFEGAPEAVLIQPDEGYRIHFQKTGTFYLHDHLNPKIYTTVIVYDPNK